MSLKEGFVTLCGISRNTKTKIYNETLEEPCLKSPGQVIVGYCFLEILGGQGCDKGGQSRDRGLPYQ